MDLDDDELIATKKFNGTYKIKILSLFSGIGAFEKALKNIGINYELLGFSEIDKYAIKSYCAIHDVSEHLNLGDVSKIKLSSLPDNIDLITHGSPCQDFSIAGKLAGGDKGSGTRSSLMWCTVDIVEKAQPKYVIWENVKNVLSKKNRHNFDGYIEIMSKLGYNSYYQILNAKDYGIPQNRERVFTVSIRKDIDTGYKFPEKQKLELKLKDLLEDIIDEKYYLSDKLLTGLINNTKKQNEKGNGFSFQTTDGNCVAKTITTRVGACRTDDNYIKVIGKLNIKGQDSIKRVYDSEGISPTLTNMQGGNRQPKVAVAMRGRYNPDGTIEQKLEISNREIANSITTIQKDSLVGEPCLKYIGSIKDKDIIGDGKKLSRNASMGDRVYDSNGVSTTISACGGGIGGHSGLYAIKAVSKDSLKIKEATKQGYKEAYEGDGVNISGRMKWQRGNVQKGMIQTLVTSGHERGVVTSDMRVRKLTPRECWRLMGFTDEDFEKARDIPTSDTQLYKQARKFNMCTCP